MNFRPAGMSSDEDDEDLYDYGYDDGDDPVRKKRTYEPPAVPVTQSQRVNRELNVKYEKDRALNEFFTAVEYHDFEDAEYLLQAGVPIDGSFPGQWTALMQACSRGDQVAVEFLLGNGANPNLHKGENFI